MIIKRRLLGADVTEMMRQGVVIDGLLLTLVIYRSGLNYRLLAQDVVNNCEYNGNVWAQDMAAFLDEYNLQYPGSSLVAKQMRVMPWQHTRVVALLAANLSLTTKITAATKQLGAASTRNPLTLVFMKDASGYGIEHTKNLQRGLKDQANILRRLQRMNDRAVLAASIAEKKLRQQHR